MPVKLIHVTYCIAVRLLTHIEWKTMELVLDNMEIIFFGKTIFKMTNISKKISKENVKFPGKHPRKEKKKPGRIVQTAVTHLIHII